MPNEDGPFRVEGSIGVVFEADTLEECKEYVLARPDQFPPKRQVTIRGPSVADPTIEDRFPFVPPTLSVRFREELLQAMGSEKGSVTSWPEETERVPGQLAAVWFSNNRMELGKGRRICVVRTGPQVRDIGLVYDLTPERPPPTYSASVPMTPPFLSLNAVARFVLDYLL